MPEVTVTCIGKNHQAKFTCTGNTMGCSGIMNDYKFDRHMKVCHPSADNYRINVEARRLGQAMFVDLDDTEDKQP